MNSVDQTDLRTLTINALREGTAGLDAFDDLFKRCSDAFEQGDDKAGHKQIAELLGHLRDFAVFCGAILEHSQAWIPASSVDELTAANQVFERTLHALLSGYEAGDVISVADVLRIDFCDVMNRYRGLFPRLAQQMECEAGV